MPSVADTEQLEALLSHRAWLTKLARHLVDAAHVDDVVQDTWLAALRSPPPADRPPRQWLGRVLRNVVGMRRRATARRGRREALAANDAPDTGTPEAILARVRLEQRLVELVTALDEPLRATVLLRYHEGLSAADIARQQGVPDATVRWRISRALSRLRDELDEDARGDRSDWRLAFLPLTGVARSSAGATIVANGAIVNIKVIAIMTGLGAVVLGAALADRRPRPESEDSAAMEAAPAVASSPPRVDDPMASGLAGPTDRTSAPARIDDERRAAMIEAVETARARRMSEGVGDAAGDAPRSLSPVAPPPLDKDYIREQIASLHEVFEECFSNALERDPSLAGTLMMTFAITGEPDVGGIVEASAVDAEASTLRDPALIECVVESSYTMQFPPPPEGGHVVVHYPIAFPPAGPPGTGGL